MMALLAAFVLGAMVGAIVMGLAASGGADRGTRLDVVVDDSYTPIRERVRSAETLGVRLARRDGWPL